MFNNKESVEKLHDATLRVLEEIGLDLPNEKILKIVKDAGIKVEGTRAYFTREQTIKYLNMAPSEFVIEGRNPENNIKISRETHTYSPGYGCSKIREYDGNVRDALLDDHMKFIELTHVFDYYGLNGGILAQPNDVNPDLSYQIMTIANMYKSDKPTIFMPGEYKPFKEMMEIGSIVFGGEENFKKSPKTITWVNPLSPLGVAEDALDSILLCCEYNQAICITAGGLAGALTPITTAGTVLSNNAESYGLIALIQLIKPGHPVVHGLSPIVYDMRFNTASVGTPQYTRMTSFGSDLSGIYNIPTRTSGEQSDSNGITAQAGYESMINVFNARLVGASLIQQAGGILDAYATISFEKLIVDMEIIRMVEYYFQEPVVNDKTIAFDELKQVVESGKNFLGAKHTVKFCRKDPWKSTIAEIGKLKIDDTPNNLFKQKVDTQLDKMISSYKVPEMEEEIKVNLKNYALSIGIDQEVIGKIMK